MLASADQRYSLRTGHFFDKWDKHSTSLRRDEFWVALRHSLTTLQIPGTLLLNYAEASLSIYTKSRKTMVKITTGGEIFVDFRVKNGDVKSRHFKYETIQESVEHFVLCLQQYLQIPLLD